MPPPTALSLVATCALGLEELLAAELAALGIVGQLSVSLSRHSKRIEQQTAG